MNLSKAEYQRLIVGISWKIADILAEGEGVEVTRSRSGIKLHRFKKRHEVTTRPSVDGVRGD